MSFHHQQIAPPNAWDEFEDLCLALFQAEWQDATTQKNRRQGQADSGVDVFGINHAQGGGLWGVQCKFKGASRTLTIKEITSELAKADAFELKLAHWIIVTTAANDAGVDEYVRQLNASRVKKNLFQVSVYFWDKIKQLLLTHLDVAKRFYPDHFAQLSPPLKPLRLPATNLSVYFSDPTNLLEQLRQQLLAKGSSALLAAATVQGMGGVGKTQLALNYCLAFQAHYTGVWWLQAETASRLEQDCRLFCHKQHVQMAQGELASAAMCNWLEGQTGWLLVFDNVEDVTLLRSWLPKAGKHHVLITSRLRSGWAGMSKLELDVWQENQALQFLRLRLAGTAGVPDAQDDEQLRLLAQALDGLPLALEQACAYIEKCHVSIAAYCQRIQAHDSAQRLLRRSDSEFAPRSVLDTLSLALEKLSESALLLLELCAWLATEPIPEYLFTEIPAKLPTELATELPLTVRALASDEFAWRETVAELEQYALCQATVISVADHMGNGEEEVRCLNFHRLTQAAVRTSEHGQQTGGTALVLVRAAFPLDANYPQHWSRCRTLTPHVLRLQDLYQENWQQAAHYVWLLEQLALYLKVGPALYQQAESLERQALLIQKNTLGEEHPATLTSMNNLAATLWQMGDLPRAQALHEKALEICRRVLGEEHPDTLTAINNLAATLREMGDFPGARALEAKTLEIRRRVLGEEHPATLTSINNLASTLWHMGDLAGAQELQEKAREIRRRVLGEAHPDTLISTNNLAITLYHLSEFTAAQSMMEQAYTGCCRVLGEEHPFTLKAKQNLANIIAAQKNSQTW
jgi:tetratricopeptide (TPR) repeat protein